METKPRRGYSPLNNIKAGAYLLLKVEHTVSSDVEAVIPEISTWSA